MDLFELWFSPALGPAVGLLSHMVALSSVQSLSRVRIVATLWTAACQAALSITNSQSLLKLMSIDLVMPSSDLILCRPLLLLSPIPPTSLELIQMHSFKQLSNISLCICTTAFLSMCLLMDI